MNDYNDEISESPLSDIMDELKEPSMYIVLIHNDDYTTMEFVVSILMTIFHKTYVEAERIMMKVHKEGYGVCGIYPYEIAETKVNEVHEIARKNEFPLKSSLKKV
jgi:ATP-dependent Clp protease adaptor protein ClpS